MQQVYIFYQLLCCSLFVFGNPFPKSSVSAASWECKYGQTKRHRCGVSGSGNVNLLVSNNPGRVYDMQIFSSSTHCPYSLSFSTKCMDRKNALMGRGQLLSRPFGKAHKMMLKLQSRLSVVAGKKSMTWFSMQRNRAQAFMSRSRPRVMHNLLHTYIVYDVLTVTNLWTGHLYERATPPTLPPY